MGVATRTRIHVEPGYTITLRGADHRLGGRIRPGPDRPPD
jgi:hypothetical protein